METLQGSCHCGAVSFQLALSKPVSDIVPRACQCSFCSTYHATYITDPKAHLCLSFNNPEEVSHYSFGHKTAEFIICKTCGTHVAALSNIEGTWYGIVNANTIQDTAFCQPIQTDFDDETMESRLQRRKQNWISTVHFDPTPLVIANEA
ncbi:MAG: GFA family protein [Vampirovibrionales bacterium]